MNKNAMREELENIGICMESFQFSSGGYVIEMRLNPDKASGWEEVEQLPIIGLEVAKVKVTGAYTRKYLYIPSNSKEFKDYVRRYLKVYGSDKQKAFEDLSLLIQNKGTNWAKIALTEYLRRTGHRK